ncbi:plasma kallikrein-like [Saccoglossus kowalevskii]|uniref:Plasma kallikrein-like n=1 Tax=Saccoglossus kowalevskii TaxID=10224 RepID=A0ABM0LTQ4_SACKO|nr:PREDICTED: plasma kallikrein-like [Saccoglossus kowalevskii]
MRRVCCVEEDICDVHEADSGCGSRVTISESRIVGGQDALPGEWPWQAQLYYIPVGNEVCGGTLVGPRHVVSAAHCFDDPPYPDAWIVRLGRYTRGNPPSPADDESIEVGVQEIIRHNEFYGIQNNDNDIALIILDQDVSTTDFINYACLDDDVTFYEDSCCYITGWGTLEFLGDQPNILQEAVVSILSNDTCIASYWSPLVTENMVCAGYLTGGIDSCQGDSGGPLVCIHTDADTGISRWHLAGITSWGFGCAYPGYPGVYTRVSKYYGWLQDHGVPF